MSQEQELLNAIVTQRNNALNDVAGLAARVAVMQAEKDAQQVAITELEKQLLNQGEEADKIEMKLNDTVTSLTNHVAGLKDELKSQDGYQGRAGDG